MRVFLRRREFVAAFGAAAAWPLAAPAQRLTLPVLGLLNGASFEGPYAAPVAAIRRGLEETGFIEGRNLIVEYRAANGRYEQLPELTADLIQSQVTVVVAIGAPFPELALRAAVAPIPIVFATASDSVEVGVIDGRDRPNDNGMARSASAGAASKRVDLLLGMRPGARLIGYLDNSRLRETFRTNVENVTTAAAASQRELLVFDAGTEQEVDTVFNRIALQRVRGLVVGPDPFLISRQEQIIALAAESGVPTIYPTRGAAVLGGLMSYGALTEDMYRLAGIYAGRILKGETPSDFPIALPTRFEFVINRRTAEALRITVPRQLMVRADEVIY
jgi:ABC-type uncharacterized transport system substrate-binding protein